MRIASLLASSTEIVAALGLTEDLVAVADALDQLEANDSDGLAAEVFREFWLYPAAIALMLSLIMVWRQEA